MESFQTQLGKLIEKIKADAFEEGYYKGWDEGIASTCKVENRPSHEGKTTAWVNIPEAEEPSVKECFEQMEKTKDEFFGYITRMQGNLCQAEKQATQTETEIEMLWNEVERIKARLPKEWK